MILCSLQTNLFEIFGKNKKMKVSCFVVRNADRDAVAHFQPTPLPTLIPTPPPTLIPTPLPTLIPTPLPTPIPTERTI